VPAEIQVPGAAVDGMFLYPVFYQNRHEQAQRYTTKRQIRVGRNRKSPSRTTRVQAAIALYGKATVVLEPVPPVMPVSTNAQPFTAQRASDIRFRVGIFLGSQYGQPGRREHEEPPFWVLSKPEVSHVSVFRTYPGSQPEGISRRFQYADFSFSVT